MIEIYPAVGGAVSIVAVVFFVARSLNGRMNHIEKNTVAKELCDERNGNLQKDVREMKGDIKEIKAYLMPDKK